MLARRMTSLWISLVSTCLGLGALWPVHVALAADAETKPAPSTQPATRPAEERPRPKPKPIYGTIIKVEDGDLRLRIGDAGREVIVPVEPDTEVLIAGKQASLADLGPDWTVNLVQEQGLTRTINARPPRPRPVPKSPERRDGAPTRAATEK